MKNIYFKPLLLLLAACSITVFTGCGGDDPDPPAVTPSLSITSTLEVEEGNTNKTIALDISLSEVTTDTVYAFIETADGTAAAGEDYTALGAFPLVFTPGDLRETVSVSIIGDEDFEQDETFTVKIVNPINGTLGSSSTATVTLLNDDPNTNLNIPTTGYTTPESYPNMTLIWQDEFNDATLDATKWTHEMGTGSNGWGNNELQYYRPDNTFMRDGNLVIEARKESFGGRAYTSSRMITQNKFSFKYGRVDIRAALPYGQGIWPALWMLGDNFSTVGWPACGEIDVMEMIGGEGNDNTVHGTVHWSANGSHAEFGGSYTLPSGILYDEFHVFSIVWNANSIKWYIDDIQYHEISTSPADLSEFRESFFFIFNVAVGGNWPGNPNASTAFPQRMIVDYVRVFQ